MEVPGFKVTKVDDIHIQNLKKNEGLPNEMYRVDPPGVINTKLFCDDLSKILDFKVFPDDTWVISFPKCGTTWTQEMAWMLVNNLDYEKGFATPLPYRFPYLEMNSMVPDMPTPDLEAISNMPRPRCIKSHLPVELLPRELWTVKPKVIYVSRNPKDAVISYYHHYRLWEGYWGTFEDFFNAFVADRELLAPYWPNFLGFWNIRHENYILFNSFEEMKKDLPAVIKRTAAFLKVDLTEEQLTKLTQHLSFESMKNNSSVNYEETIASIRSTGKMQSTDLKFMRSGETGGWKKQLTPEMLERIDEWTKRELKDSELNDYPF